MQPLRAANDGLSSGVTCYNLGSIFSGPMAGDFHGNGYNYQEAGSPPHKPRRQPRTERDRIRGEISSESYGSRHQGESKRRQAPNNGRPAGWRGSARRWVHDTVVHHERNPPPPGAPLASRRTFLRPHRPELGSTVTIAVSTASSMSWNRGGHAQIPARGRSIDIRPSLARRCSGCVRRSARSSPPRGGCPSARPPRGPRPGRPTPARCADGGPSTNKPTTCPAGELTARSPARSTTPTQRSPSDVTRAGATAGDPALRAADLINARFEACISVRALPAKPCCGRRKGPRSHDWHVHHEAEQHFPGHGRHGATRAGCGEGPGRIAPCR